jgi:hypothetical protein
MSVERTRIRLVLGLGAAAITLASGPRARAATMRDITVYKNPT